MSEVLAVVVFEPWEQGADLPMSAQELYQIEVKLCVISLAFPSSAGWKVTVDLDPMELARGGAHPDDKVARATAALEKLRGLGVTIGKHDLYGRADIVAEHPDHGRRIIEVGGRLS